MRERLIQKTRVQLVVGSLLVASLITMGIHLGRLAWGSWKFSAFTGNLVLAWIPVVGALAAYSMRARRSQRTLVFTAAVVVWFFFYPNAPYLVTDLVHLKTRPPVPRWYDLILIMSYAWTGVVLGWLSLYLMQEVVRDWRGRIAGWIFSISMLLLGALGVFVGRFWRWNSWEVVTKPWGLASDAAHRFAKMPVGELLAFCLTFFAFSLLTYLPLYTLAHLHNNIAPDLPESKRPLPPPGL